MSKIVVVDTSVLISALIGKEGPSREILRKCLVGTYKPLISNTLFSEYEDVVARQRIVDLCPLTDDEKRKLINAFYNTCRWISIHYLWRPNVKDEGDNFLIELAVAGSATHIITNNINDFKNSELKFPNLEILTPEQLLRGK
jgi:putative PIN family toxin of toxin-antitoxin system